MGRSIGPRVTLRFADGSKRKIEMYDRPDGFTLNLQLQNGDVVKGLHFRRTGPDEYAEKVFEEGEQKWG